MLSNYNSLPSYTGSIAENDKCCMGYNDGMGCGMGHNSGIGDKDGTGDGSGNKQGSETINDIGCGCGNENGCGFGSGMKATARQIAINVRS